MICSKSYSALTVMFYHRSPGVSCLSLGACKLMIDLLSNAFIHLICSKITFSSVSSLKMQWLKFLNAGIASSNMEDLFNLHKELLLFLIPSLCCSSLKCFTDTQWESKELDIKTLTVILQMLAGSVHRSVLCSYWKSPAGHTGLVSGLHLSSGGSGLSRQPAWAVK